MSTATCTPDVRGPSVAETTSAVEQANPAATNQAGAESYPTKAGDSSEAKADFKPATQRDAKGRFGPGNLGGPGNPFARQLAKFRAFIMKCNTEEHMTFAFNKMMELIADGNVGALKLYFLYIIGKPADAVDPDKLDLAEWNGYKETAGMVDEASALMKAPASDLPLTLLRIGKAAVTQKMRDFAAYNIEHPEEMQKAKAEAARKRKEELEKALKKLDEPAPASMCPELAARGLTVPVVGNGRPPSANGDNGHVSPSQNGGTGPADPRGSQSLTPRLEGDGPADQRGSQSLTPRLEGDGPSPNGGNGEAAVAEALAEEFEAILGRLRGGRPAA
jgi:hypothetical protein